MAAADIGFAVGRRHEVHERLKRFARDAIELGASNPRVQARYRARLDVIRDRGLDLDGAIRAIEDMFRAEQRQATRVIAADLAHWGVTPDRMALMVLGEMRLVGRWLRRYHAYALSQILDRPPARIVAAE
jgi:hypothetical protein